MPVGATGTIGSDVATLRERGHEVVRVSRQSAPPIDLADSASIAAMLGSVAGVDAIVCCAASAPLTPLLADGFMASLEGKLLGQLELVRLGLEHVRDGGSITLTSGKIPDATPGSAGGALVKGWTTPPALRRAPTSMQSRAPCRAR